MHKKKPVRRLDLASSLQLTDPGSLAWGDWASKRQSNCYETAVILEDWRVKERLLHLVLNHVNAAARVLGETEVPKYVNDVGISSRLCLSYGRNGDWLRKRPGRAD